MPKRTWNYRVVRVDHEGGEQSYMIHSVHYVDGQIWAYSTDPTQAYGSSPDSLRFDIDLMRAALEKPVLTHEQIDAEMEASHLLHPLRKTFNDYG